MLLASDSSILTSESWHKGCMNCPFPQESSCGWRMDEASGYDQCCEFPSVLWHWWFGNKKDVWLIKSMPLFLNMFSSAKKEIEGEVANVVVVAVHSDWWLCFAGRNGLWMAESSLFETRCTGANSRKIWGWFWDRAARLSQGEYLLGFWFVKYFRHIKFEELSMLLEEAEGGSQYRAGWRHGLWFTVWWQHVWVNSSET